MGARVRDSCTTNVTLTNDFNSQRLLTCTSAAVTFRACDNCGNCDSRATTIVIEDSVAPVFSSFPQNYELPCDADLSETVLGQRGSGPCPPEGCECDGCCPPPAASDCLPVDCEAVSCSSAPCQAVQCSCSNSKEATHSTAARD